MMKSSIDKRRNLPLGGNNGIIHTNAMTAAVAIFTKILVHLFHRCNPRSISDNTSTVRAQRGGQFLITCHRSNRTNAAGPLEIFLTKSSFSLPYAIIN